MRKKDEYKELEFMYFNKMLKRHGLRLTYGNCTPPYGGWVPQNRSRANALCAVSLHHILRLLAFASQSPSTQPQNVSYLLRYVPFFLKFLRNFKGKNHWHIAF